MVSGFGDWDWNWLCDAIRFKSLEDEPLYDSIRKSEDERIKDLIEDSLAQMIPKPNR